MADNQSRLARGLRQLRIFALGALGGVLLRLLAGTLRWEIKDFSEGAWLKANPIIAFWHNRQLFAAYLQVCRRRLSGRRDRAFIMISAHTDGRMVSIAARFFGIESVAGSSTRGGLRAALQLVRLSKAGHVLSITPDGPKGPPYEAKMGVVTLAERAGVPIFAFGVAAKNFWRFGSWDKMILPKPFSPAVIYVSAAITIPECADAEQREQWRLRVEQVINSVTAEADNHWDNGTS